MPLPVGVQVAKVAMPKLRKNKEGKLVRCVRSSCLVDVVACCHTKDTVLMMCSSAAGCSHICCVTQRLVIQPLLS